MKNHKETTSDNLAISALLVNSRGVEKDDKTFKKVAKFLESAFPSDSKEDEVEVVATTLACFPDIVGDISEIPAENLEVFLKENNLSEKGGKTQEWKKYNLEKLFQVIEAFLSLRDSDDSFENHILLEYADSFEAAFDVLQKEEKELDSLDILLRKLLEIIKVTEYEEGVMEDCADVNKRRREIESKIVDSRKTTKKLKEELDSLNRV